MSLCCPNTYHWVSATPYFMPKHVLLPVKSLRCVLFCYWPCCVSYLFIYLVMSPILLLNLWCFLSYYCPCECMLCYPWTFGISYPISDLVMSAFLPLTLWCVPSYHWLFVSAILLLIWWCLLYYHWYDGVCYHIIKIVVSAILSWGCVVPTLIIEFLISPTSCMSLCCPHTYH